LFVWPNFPFLFHLGLNLFLIYTPCILLSNIQVNKSFFYIYFSLQLGFIQTSLSLLRLRAITYATLKHHIRHKEYSSSFTVIWYQSHFEPILASVCVGSIVPPAIGPFIVYKWVQTSPHESVSRGWVRLKVHFVIQSFKLRTTNSKSCKKTYYNFFSNLLRKSKKQNLEWIYT